VDRWERLDQILGRIEQSILITFLSGMILIAFLQILLRNFFSTGLDWGDMLLRNLVLWVGFLGATLATREGKHINIDLIAHRLSAPGKNAVALVIHLFSFVICLLLTYAALKFIKNEAQMGNFTLLRIPAWIPETILPGTFGLMTFRFGLRFFRALPLLRKNPSPAHRVKET
jgi:C4-dicarboxylate transporter, DctQ subunit